jgi:hypothetical protein
MSYADLRDFEAEYETVTDEGLKIQIEKLGGGTLGKSYVGTWLYVVTGPDGVELERGMDFETNLPSTHEQAASVLAHYFV